MEPSQVRTRLSAGGKWIRTYGPSQGFRHPSRWRANRRRASERPFLYGGTGGSNPSQRWVRCEPEFRFLTPWSPPEPLGPLLADAELVARSYPARRFPLRVFRL